MTNGYEEDKNGAYFYDFYFDKNGHLMRTEGIEGIMINTVEDLYISHYQYEEKISNTNYVPVGSIIACTLGSILAKVSSDEAPGVYVGNGAPVLTCDHCQSGKNIPTFGSCRCTKEERIKLDMPETKKGNWGSAQGKTGEIYIPNGYKCVPMINEGWKQPGKNTVLIWNSLKKDYTCALKDNAILVCRYGGIIGVVEVNNSTGREITFPDVVKGTVNNKYQELNPNTNWFSFKASENGVMKDAGGFHKISVGPRILDPSYPDSGKLELDDFGGNLKVRINVVLENKDTGDEKILKCVATGIKAHTYNIHPDTKQGQKHKIFTYNKNIKAKFEIDNGLIQTGIAYPNCSNGKKDSPTDGPIALDHMNSSPVEFSGTKSDLQIDGKREYDYKLVKLIVLG